MDTKTAIQKAEELLKPWELSNSTPQDFRYDVVIAPENLHLAVMTLVENNWGYLIAITGIDRPVLKESEENQPENQIEALYHFGEGAAVTTIHIFMPYSQLSIDSVCDLIPSASMYERELMEMLGVNIVDTPDRNKLVLPDEWPDGVYPLRKSFTGLNQVTFEEYE